MSDDIGQSGITYHCRCGASSAKQRDSRLMDAEGWGLTYVAAKAGARSGTKSVAVYLCPACNPRGKVAKSPAG